MGCEAKADRAYEDEELITCIQNDTDEQKTDYDKTMDNLLEASGL
jgi:hypothetical protein